MSRHRWIPALLLVAIAGLAACSSSNSSSKSVVCTAVGCSSGAFIGLTAFTSAHGALTQAIVCIDEHCETHRPTNGPLGLAGVTTALTHEGAVTVKVTLKGAGGRVVASDSIKARLRKNQPNGPKCEPTCYVALLHITPAGKLDENTA